jgi:sec-independent protein translocase protein TatA
MPLAFIDTLLSPSTMMLIAIVALLLYGERLPEVAKSFGKQFSEFKRNMQNVRQEFESAVSSATSAMEVTSHHKEASAEGDEATAPKFDPPPAEEPTAPKFEPPPSAPGAKA